MSITDLIERVKESAKKRTQQQRRELLKQANIIDEDGFYLAEYFSEKTVAADKAKRREQNESIR